jgi:hypothetical protein
MSERKEIKGTLNVEKKLEPTKRGTRLISIGTGIRMSQDGLDGLSCYSPILYHPESGESDIGLIQGGVQVGAVENGLAITFDAPYGYYLRGDARSVQAPAELHGRWERDVFSFGFHAYQTALNLIREYTGQIIQPLDRDGTQGNAATEKALTIVINELQSLEDRVMINLVDRYSRTFRLRDDRGYFRWIGLAQLTDTGRRYPSTIMQIPNVIEGTKRIFLRANSVPMQGGTSSPVLPMAENLWHGFFAGAIHRFEEEDKYIPGCAIRATNLASVFKGNFGIQTLLSSAAREGIYPRIASRSGNGEYFWQKLAALAMVQKFYATYYNATIPNNIGEVKYTFSGTGLTKVLEQMINMYIESSMLAIKTEQTNTKEGVFFMPASNEYDAQFDFAFSNNPQSESDYMMMNISDLRSKLYWRYDGTPAIVGDDGYIEVSEEMMREDKWRPLVIKPVHTLRERVQHLGAGFETRTLEISDTFNDEIWSPREMLESLLIGWAPAFQPKSIILRNAQTPSSFREYRGFEMLNTAEKDQLSIRKIGTPWERPWISSEEKTAQKRNSKPEGS